jgi:hypothetical protein
MALYTKGYLQNAMVLLASGDSETDTSHVDITFADFKTAGYYHFKIFLTDIYVHDSYSLRLYPMITASNFASGMYGGYYSFGESQGVITYNDSNFNATAYIPLATEKTTTSVDGTYRGNFEIDYSIREASISRPNVWWQGIMRIDSVNSAHISGACLGTASATYGVRLSTNASGSGSGANGLLGYEYAIYGIPTS